MNIIKTIRNDWPEIKEAWSQTDKTPLWQIGWMLLVIAFLLASCATSRAPLDTPETPVAGRSVRIIPPQEGLPGRVGGLSTEPVKTDKPDEKPGFIAKVLHSVGIGYKVKNTSEMKGFINPTIAPKKCKGCTIIYGNDNTVSQAGKKATTATGKGATSTITGKKSGPAVIASDSVDQAVAGANTQQVVTRGNGNQVDAKKQDTTQEAPGPLAVLADNFTSWIPYAAGAGVLLLALWLWRKKKQAETLIS